MQSRFMVSLVVILVSIGSHVGRAAPPSMSWWITHALQKVRPYDQEPAQRAPAVELEAARNEFEPFQIVLCTEAATLEGVDVEFSDLVGPDNAIIARKNATVYLESYIMLRRPSSVEGKAGEWPDPLIPRVDRYLGQRRNGFPFELRRGRNQPLWIEIYVPQSTRPGNYAGQVKISVRGLAYTSIPVKLKVWSFTLPSTSSLPTAFGFSGVAALKEHRGRYTSDEDLYEITYLYTKAALLHRISTYGGSMVSPPFSWSGERIRVDWSAYDNEIGPFMDGKVLGAGEPLAGAKATSADLRSHASFDTEEHKVLYLREWVRHFREKGWYERLFHYLWDEPAPGDYDKVFEKGALTRRAERSLRNLVTAPFDRTLAAVIDIWSPLINCFESKPGFEKYCEAAVPRLQYQSEIEQGKQLWWYQSCASHGCNQIGGEYFRGWPGYQIDVHAISNRIMKWLAWKYKVAGELYFSMNDSFSRVSDPWEEVYMHGGNGDGTLFYPGRADKIGGSDIPIESIRLKLIREGLEDYEYLALLARTGEAGFGDECVNRIVKKTYLWEHQPETLYAVRRSMGERLSQGKLSESHRRY